MWTNFKPLPAQRRLIEVPHEMDTDIALYQGGVGSGKTTAGVILGYLLSRIYPGSRGLVGAATHALLRDTTRCRWRDIVPPGDIAAWNRNPDNLVLRNGSEIWFRHLSDPDRLSSMEFNWIHVEEGAQIRQRVFHALLARLRHTDFGCVRPHLRARFRLFVTSNPEEEYGWLYERFVEPKEPRPNVRFIRAPTVENVHLMKKKPDYIDTIRDVVDTDYARIYLDGYTGGLRKGRVYRNFDRAKDVSDTVAYDPARPLHASFDFNVDFMVVLLIQEHPEGRTEIVDEIVLRNGTDTATLCRAIKEKYGEHAAGFGVHGDATGYARHHRTSLNDYAIIRRELGGLRGLRFYVRRGSANPSVRDRTNAVNFRLQNANGERRMRLSSRCRYLIRSLERTRYLPGTFEKEKIRDPDDARFVIDHAGDALDYYIADTYPFHPERLHVVPYL